VAATAASTCLVLLNRPRPPVPPVFDYRAAVITSRLPLVLDPLLAPQDPGVAEVSSLLYRPLLRLDNTGYPAPDLPAPGARAWTA